MSSSIDHATRTEELARYLAASFGRLTLARFIAHDALLPALRQAYGNPALREIAGCISEAVAEFDQAQRAAAIAAAREERRKARAAEAEALFQPRDRQAPPAVAASATVLAEAPIEAPSRPRLL